MIDKNEIIHCESYRLMCDYLYEGQDDLPSGIVGVDAQSLKEFFTKIFNNGKSYIVVSSHSDYGLRIQSLEPPWKDIEKWCGMTATHLIGYDNYCIGARVDKEQCNQNDYYSIKCWSQTSHTFNEIPSNVKHLFMTNCGVIDERITNIPFGIAGIKNLEETLEKISKFETNKKRDKLLYVNFQYCTIDRYRLFQYYKDVDWATCYERGRTADEYYNDLLTHKFVLCPEGNGPDCFRNLETIYCGAIPIMPISNSLIFYLKNNQKVLMGKSLYNLNEPLLESFYSSFQEKIITNKDFVKVSYWKNLIESKRSLL